MISQSTIIYLSKISGLFVILLSMGYELAIDGLHMTIAFLALLCGLLVIIAHLYEIKIMQESNQKAIKDE